MLSWHGLLLLYISLAVILGAIIGAERQWRQRMAGLRTNALVSTGAAIFILCSVSTPEETSGRIAAQVVSGVGFLGAGVIMRQGKSISGLNTAATLWCSAAVGVLCGMGQFANATVATLILLCANILLREAAQFINLQPKMQHTNTDTEQCYHIQITCKAEDEILVRTLILHALDGMSLRLTSLCRVKTPGLGQLYVCENILGAPHAHRELESFIYRISLEKKVSSVCCSIAEGSVPH